MLSPAPRSRLQHLLLFFLFTQLSSVPFSVVPRHLALFDCLRNPSATSGHELSANVCRHDGHRPSPHHVLPPGYLSLTLTDHHIVFNIPHVRLLSAP